MLSRERVSSLAGALDAESPLRLWFSFAVVAREPLPACAVRRGSPASGRSLRASARLPVRVFPRLRPRPSDQALGQCDDATHHGGLAWYLKHVLGEAAVDLHRVERQEAEVAQRGVSRAEVIDREAKAAFVDASERVAHEIGIVHQHNFSELELDSLGVNSVGPSFLDQQRQQPRVEKVGAGEIDCDVDVEKTGVGPLA